MSRPAAAPVAGAGEPGATAWPDLAADLLSYCRVSCSRPIRSGVVALIAAAAAAGTARAGSGDGNSLVAIGMGPPATVSGALAERVHGDGGTARVRLGGRFGALGCDLAISNAMLDDGVSDSSGLWLITPTLAVYPVHNPWLQLGARAGLGFGALGHRRTVSDPWCGGEEGCQPGAHTETTRHSAVAADLGVTGQLQLGRRRGGRAVVWLDAGVALTRVGFDDAVVSGRVFQLTVGIGHGMAL